MSETFYDVLGVTDDASRDEITDAYRARIKETHPDVSEAEDAEERAKKVIEAKEVLADEEERDRYDRLGHQAYVRETSMDASWTATGAATSADEDVGASTPGERTWRSNDGEGGTWAGRGDWHEEESVDAGAARTEASADERTEQRQTAESTAGAEQPNERRAGGSGAGEERQSAGSGRTAASNVGGPVGWATGGRHAVRNEPGRSGVHRSRLFPPEQSVVLLVSTFVCYPSMVFSSVFPAFPLIVNLTVGVCTLVVIGYLTSIPEVGVYVFGGWSLIATLLLIASGTSPFTFVGLVALGATWLPLGLTFLTYWVLRW